MGGLRSYRVEGCSRYIQPQTNVAPHKRMFAKCQEPSGSQDLGFRV